MVLILCYTISGLWHPEMTCVYRFCIMYFHCSKNLLCFTSLFLPPTPKSLATKDLSLSHRFGLSRTIQSLSSLILRFLHIFLAWYLISFFKNNLYFIFNTKFISYHFHEVAFFVVVAAPRGMWDPGPGIKPTPLAVEAQSLNHWSTSEVPPHIL